MNIQCDRCKIIYTSEYPEFYEDQNKNTGICMTTSEISYGGVFRMSDDNRTKYLCPKCTYELNQWIQNYKEGKQ